MVFTDGIHLVASSVERLHAFAESIGLKKSWFQNHTRHPHYDLMKSKQRLALKAGAVLVSKKTIVEFCRIMYTKRESQNTLFHQKSISKYKI